MEAAGQTRDMAELRPNPSLIVSSGTTIGDCIRRMRDHGTGSVLVIAETFPHDLVGIFTERDVLKWIDEIQHGGYWEKPVGVLMSKQLKTISIYELDSAPRVMIEAGIRHLPVVYDTEDGVQSIAGVISIKDLMKRLSELMTPEPPAQSKVIAVAALDEKHRKGLKTLLSQGGRMPVIELGENAPARVGELENRHTVGIVALDLDGYATEEWLACVQAAQARPEGPAYLLIYTATAHSPKNVAYLKELGKSERFAVLVRPFTPLDALHRVRVWLGSRTRLA